jgi:hypothetical protein
MELYCAAFQEGYIHVLQMRNSHTQSRNSSFTVTFKNRHCSNTKLCQH